MTRSIFYVYVALGKVSGQYKIGFSRDVRNRFRSLPEPIDVNRSFYVECSASMPARRMEFILHFILHPYRILEPGPGRGPEWFEPACYGPLQSFVEEHHERLGVSKLRPVARWRKKPPPTPPPLWLTYLTTEEAAKRLKRSVKTLEYSRLVGQGPPFYRQGRVIRYLLSEVLAWGASRRVAPDTAA